MASNSIDIGALQNGGQSVGAMQGTTNQTIAESFTLGLSQGVTFSYHLTAVGALTLALSQGISFLTNIAAHNTVTMGVSCGITPAAKLTARAAIALGLTAETSFSTNADLTVSITLGLGGLDLSFRRFVDADFTLGLELGIEFDDELAGATPGTFRPGGPSGPARIFRAVDAGDEVPGVFRPATEFGTPGRFKPTSWRMF